MRAIPRFRLKMAAKAAVLIAGLGVMSVLANSLVLQRLDRLDDLNNVLVNHSAPGRLALTEAKTSVTSMGVAVYKMVSTGDIDVVRESIEERQSQFVSAMSWLGGAAGYLPDRRADIQRIVDRINNVNEIADTIISLSRQGEREHARVPLELKFDAALVVATTEVNRLINILGGEI